MIQILKPALGIPVISILFGWLLLPWISQFPGGLIRDDGYFYAQIAYNIGTHGVSSFDGINPTDGYHQLWCYALAGLSWGLSLWTSAKGVHLLAYVTLNFIVIGVIAWLSCRRWLGRLAVYLLMSLCSFLMEGHLAMMWIACVLVGLSRGKHKSLGNGAIVALVLLPVTRIDACLAMIPLLVMWFFSRERLMAMRVSMALGAGVALHLLLLRTFHGSWVTVSSLAKVMKAVSTSDLFTANLVHGVGSLPIPINPMPLIFFALAILSCVLVMRATEYRRLLMGAVFGGLLFGITHLLFNEARPWYYTVPYGIFILCSLKALESQARTLDVLSALLCSVCLLALGISYRQALKYRDEASASREFLSSVGRYVPAGEAVYMVDGSGYAGWVGDRAIVNGDGLVNSHAYMLRVRDSNLDGYMQEYGIHYFLTNGIGPNNPLLIRIAGLKVSRDQATEVAAKRGNGRYPYSQFVLWRLK